MSDASLLSPASGGARVTRDRPLVVMAYATEGDS